MIYILLTIVLSALLGVCFKYWSKYEIKVLPGLLHNYVACVVMAALVHGSFPLSLSHIENDWFPYALGLSLCFLTGFYLFGLAVWYWGVAIMSAIQKMSLIVSTAFAIYYFKELLGIWQIIAICLGVLSLPLLMAKTAEPEKPGVRDVYTKGLYLAIGSFLIASIIEIGLLLVERGIVTVSGDPEFIGTLFFLAFCWGAVLLVFKSSLRSSFFTWKYVLAGWMLGIPNFFSIYFMMRAIGSEILSGLLLPIVNIGTLVTALLFGKLLFSETITKRNWFGLSMALLALILLCLPLIYG